MAYKWGQLQKAVHMRVQGANQKREDFRFQRMDAVRKVVEVELSSTYAVEQILTNFSARPPVRSLVPDSN
jgi:hypothetical protein